MSSTTLFNDFNPVSSKQWKQKMQFDLNGIDYNNTLVWTSHEGIQVKPFYHLDDFKERPPIHNTKVTAFKVCELIYVEDTITGNNLAIEAINGGTESIKFVIPSKTIKVTELLKDIDLNAISIYFELHFISPEYLKPIFSIPSSAKIHLGIDIIGHLARTGNWFYNLNKDFLLIQEILSNKVSNTTSMLSVDMGLYQNAGANIIQQLAYAMAHTNEYFNFIENNTSTDFPSEITITYHVGIGSNYFFEIAKLKALRILFTTIANNYTTNYKCHIFTSPSKRNMSIYDYNNNMLRTTTESMSAILGGADTICNLPYNAVFKKQNAFGSRMARNQLLILKHESYFNTVDNPTDGSYYIENLTNQLAEKALTLFKDIEKQGGFLKQLKKHTIQRKIKESATKEQDLFNSKKEIILGANKYPNQDEKIKHELELFPFIKTHKRKTLIEPIIEKRLTENLEQKRLKNE